MTIDVLTRRALGSTGWSVTGLCVGTGELGDLPVYGYQVPEERALATARRAFAGPLNFVDTSNGYGRSEPRLGTVLRELGGVPEGILLATKVDPLEDGAFDGKRVQASVQESMDRLGLSHLPLVHLHDPERIDFAEAMAPDGPVAALRDLQAEGIVGHLGVAGGPIDLLRRFADTGLFDVVLTHNRWTLLDRSAEPLLADCGAAGIAVVNGAPFGGGLLAVGSAASTRYAYQTAPAGVIRATQHLEALCATAGIPLAAVALQFSARDPRIASTVVGMSRPERYDEALRLVALPVAEELWAEVQTAAAPESLWLR
jgi:D-threo-aldose 1-dehydrogenase